MRDKWTNFYMNGRTYRTNNDATIVAYWCGDLQNWVRSISPATYAAARERVAS